MDYRTTTESPRDAAKSATDNLTGSLQSGAAAMPTSQAAAGISNSMEQHWADEPVNSTARSLLMMGAGLAVAGSLVMQFTGRKHESLFVGQWAPTLLLVALWYQLVKGQQSSQGSNGYSPYR